ncbi:unnamed protein product [Peniophora sp. CBMAI 1063]|nr:unnamed protein product [Peniophora sp. CBMAI 1063]
MRSSSASIIVTSVSCTILIKISAGPRTDVGRTTGRSGIPLRSALAPRRAAHDSRWLRAVRTTSANAC